MKTYQQIIDFLNAHGITDAEVLEISMFPLDGPRVYLKLDAFERLMAGTAITVLPRATCNRLVGRAGGFEFCALMANGAQAA